MDSSGKPVAENGVSQLYSRRLVALEWKKSGWTALFPSSGLLIGFLICYAVTVSKGLAPPVLPMISTVTGIPPACGIISLVTVICLSLGLLTHYLIITTVSIRNTNNSKFIKRAQKIAYYLIIIFGIGMILTGMSSVEYSTVANMYEYVTTVVVPHAIGAILFLFGEILFQITVTLIWWNLPDATKTNKRIKLAFMGIYILIFSITWLFLIKSKSHLEEFMNRFDLKAMKTQSVPHHHHEDVFGNNLLRFILIRLESLSNVVMPVDVYFRSCPTPVLFTSCLGSLSKKKYHQSMKRTALDSETVFVM